MGDVAYLVLILVFFVLMIAYGYGCRALGRDEDSTSTDP